MNEQSSPMHEAPENAVRDARMTGQSASAAHSFKAWALTMAAGGLLLGYVGAADSYELPLVLRLGLWLGLCAIGGLFAVTIEAALPRLGLRSRSLLVRWAVLTLGLAMTMVPVIFLVNSTGTYSQMSLLPVYAANSLAISAALVALRLTIGALLARSSPATDQVKDAPNDKAGTPAILSRLQPGLQSGQLLALNSEGHYLRVFTDLGDELILMRLKDAIAETAPVEGMQVHRSWWIARRENLEQRSEDGRIELQIAQDVWAPVSRTYRAEWKAAGW